jgi:hypothetical protein
MTSHLNEWLFSLEKLGEKLILSAVEGSPRGGALIKKDLIEI